MLAIGVALLWVVQGLGDDFRETRNGIILSAETAKRWRGPFAGVESYWTPSPEDIAALEGHLPPALEKGRKNPATIMSGPFSALSRKYTNETITSILKNFGRYRRQYAGLVIAGKRYVYVNCYPAHWPKPFPEKSLYVTVEDGGAGFWRILYSVDDGTFSRFSVNGDA